MIEEQWLTADIIRVGQKALVKYSSLLFKMFITCVEEGWCWRSGKEKMSRVELPKGNLEEKQAQKR